MIVIAEVETRAQRGRETCPKSHKVVEVPHRVFRGEAKVSYGEADGENSELLVDNLKWFEKMETPSQEEG